MKIISPDELKALCYEDGRLKPKPDSRASMINALILDPETDIDIDAAEDMVHKLLREWNLWNEPTLEELLRDDEPPAADAGAPTV